MTGLGEGMALGGATGATLLASAGLEQGSISIMAAASCTVFVAGAVWWLSAKFQRIDDKLNFLHKRMDELPCVDGCKPKRKLERGTEY